jgi:hypothetical protein
MFESRIPTMTQDRVPGLVRIGMALLAAGLAEVGVWAAFFPRAFYDHFPGGGHAWVSVDGPYNQHLVRDVGQLELGLALLFAIAALTASRSLARPVLAVSIVPAALHFAYHASHLDLYRSSDKVGNLVSLGLLAGLPVVLLAVDVRLAARSG